MKYVINILPFVVLLTILASTTYALKCYQCNSIDNPACFDVYFESTASSNDSVKRNPQLDSLLIECNQDESGRNPFCRKTTYTVLKNEHHRVIRGCGYERSRTDCYKADNEAHLETVCQCWTDGCNAAGQTKHGLITFFGIALLVKLVIY